MRKRDVRNRMMPGGREIEMVCDDNDVTTFNDWMPREERSLAKRGWTNEFTPCTYR